MSSFIPFDEHRADGLDPLDGRVQEPDFGEEDLPAPESKRDVDFACALLKWLADPARNSRPEHVQKTLACRVIGLLWLIDPGYFDDAPSLRELAKRLRVDKGALSIHSAAASKKFGIRSRAQSHAWNVGKKKPPDQKENPRGQARVEGMNEAEHLSLEGERP